MKDSPSDTTIRLKIGNDEIVIRSPEEFEPALRPRLDVRSLKHAQISVLTDKPLSDLSGLSIQAAIAKGRARAALAANIPERKI